MIYRSSLAEVSPPNQSLTDYVLADVAKRPEKNAIVDGQSGRALTYRELSARIRKAAKGLSLRGFGKGDVFALYCPNLPEYAVAFHGVARLGGVNTTINPLYTPEELRRQLNDAEARFILTVPPFLENVQEGIRETGVVVFLVVCLAIAMFLVFGAIQRLVYGRGDPQ